MWIQVYTLKNCWPPYRFMQHITYAAFRGIIDKHQQFRNTCFKNNFFLNKLTPGLYINHVNHDIQKISMQENDLTTGHSCTEYQKCFSNINPATIIIFLPITFPHTFHPIICNSCQSSKKAIMSNISNTTTYKDDLFLTF